MNLLLCGRAVSNVFDNEMKLDSGNGNFTLLKGIRERCDIGLLSLYEHYNICKVRKALPLYTDKHVFLVTHYFTCWNGQILFVCVFYYFPVTAGSLLHLNGPLEPELNKCVIALFNNPIKFSVDSSRHPQHKNTLSIQLVFPQKYIVISLLCSFNLTPGALLSFSLTDQSSSGRGGPYDSSLVLRRITMIKI